MALHVHLSYVQFCFSNNIEKRKLIFGYIEHNSTFFAVWGNMQYLEGRGPWPPFRDRFSFQNDDLFCCFHQFRDMSSIARTQKSVLKPPKTWEPFGLPFQPILDPPLICDRNHSLFLMI